MCVCRRRCVKHVQHIVDERAMICFIFITFTHKFFSVKMEEKPKTGENFSRSCGKTCATDRFWGEYLKSNVSWRSPLLLTVLNKFIFHFFSTFRFNSVVFAFQAFISLARLRFALCFGCSSNIVRIVCIISYSYAPCIVLLTLNKDVSVWW